MSQIPMQDNMIKIYLNYVMSVFLLIKFKWKKRIFRQGLI